MLALLATTEIPPSIEIGTVQSLVSLGVILLGMGIAWGTLKTSVKGIGKSLEKIETKVDGMHTSMTEHKADITGLKAHTKYGITNSPTVPSPEGKKLLEESGFNRQHAALKEKVFEILDKNKPRTLYDYEVGAFEALEALKDNPLMDPLKDYVVNNPGEPLQLIFRIASWVFRDEYAEYKGQSVKHDN